MGTSTSKARNGHPPSNGRAPDLVVVLDIDQTLVESIGDELLPAPEYELLRGGAPAGDAAERVLLRPRDPELVAAIRVHGRPGLPRFLAALRELGVGVVVWSMGTPEYVRLVVDAVVTPLLGHAPLDVLDRRACEESKLRFGCWKDLRLLADRLRQAADARGPSPAAPPQLLLVEDQPINAPWQPNQVVTVPPFSAALDEPDTVLAQLTEALTEALLAKPAQHRRYAPTRPAPYARPGTGTRPGTGPPLAPRRA